MIQRKTASPHEVVFFCVLFCFLPLHPSAGAETVEHDEASPTPVTFVSYNLRNYLEMERRVDGEVVADAPKPEDEIAALVEGLAAIRPDILSVCEIGDATHIADLQSRLKAVGIDLPYTEMVTDSAGWNRNLALLSRFPIVGRYSRDDYTYELAGTRHAFQRGVLDVKLAIRPHYHLRCVGLHLKSKREVPEGDQALMRLNEAHLARRHLDRILKEEPGVNLLVTGDFNDTRIEAPVKTLRGAYGRPGYLRALRLADEAGFTWTHYWAFADVYSRFDYALYSKGLSAEINRNLCRIHHWEGWEKASDHRPLVISLLPVDR